jgi:hypothetical protein
VALLEVKARSLRGSLSPVAAERRGHGDDNIYFDQANARRIASVSLGYSPDGKRKRRTVRGRTKTEARDKLRVLREDISATIGLNPGSTADQRRRSPSIAMC